MNEMRRRTPISGHSFVGVKDVVHSLNAPHARVLMNERPAQWIAPVIERLNELCGLSKGWNGYAAPPVEFGTAHFALAMLQSCCGPNTPTPSIVPGINGDLQIEWHMIGGDIELHVRAPNDVHAWRQAANADDDGKELLLRQDFTAVAHWIKGLAEGVNAPVSAAA